VPFVRFAAVGAVLLGMTWGTAIAAAARRDAPAASSPGDLLYRVSRGSIVGLGFGYGPWWGPYDANAPPAYAYPPPVHSVPPPPPRRGAAESQLGECREFESTVIVDGQQRLARGLACPQPDGSWRIVH
jgi:hypothetical protein